MSSGKFVVQVKIVIRDLNMLSNKGLDNIDLFHWEHFGNKQVKTKL